MSNNVLYIDSKEPKEVQENVKLEVIDRNSVPVKVTGLKTGDFVYKDVVIERKKASDLASSITDGRIKQQSVRMIEDFRTAYMVIVGDPYNLEYSNLHRNVFNGIQVSLSDKGVNVLNVPTEADFVYVVSKIISKYEEENPEKVELDRTSVNTENVFVAMLSCIEGVSKSKAEELSEIFGSVSELVFLAVGDEEKAKNMAKKVDGVGEIIAERVISTFCETQKEQ